MKPTTARSLAFLVTVLTILKFSQVDSLTHIGPKMFKFGVRGSSMDISCLWSLSTVPTTLWQGKKERIPDGNKISKYGQVFTIHNMDDTDKGQYYCKSPQTGDTAKLQKILYVFPANSVPLRSIYPASESVKSGQTSSLTCHSSGQDIKTLAWYKNKEKLSDAVQTTTKNGNNHTNTLTLDAVSGSTAGTYECRVVLNYPKNGNLRSYPGYWPVTAEVQVLEFEFLAKRRTFVVVNAGANFTINCKVTDSTATVSLWYKTDSGTQQEVVPDGQKVVQKGQRFHINGALPQDDGRLYSCKAAKPDGKTITLDMGTLLVTAGGKILEPKAGVHPFTKTVKLGENFNFTCEALGDGINISWQRNRNPVLVSQTQMLPSKLYHTYKKKEVVLTIQGASIVDSGRYTCQVTTAMMPGYKHEAYIELTVECPKADGKFRDPKNKTGYIECSGGTAVQKTCPIKLEWDDKAKICKERVLEWLGEQDILIHVISGLSVVVNCNLSDSSEPVQLLKDQKTLTPDGKKITKSGQIFTIYQFSKADFGQYSCKTAAKTSQQRSTQLSLDPDFSHHVWVHAVPKCAKWPLDHLDSISITCFTRHTGAVKWFKIDSQSSQAIEITDGSKVKHSSTHDKYGLQSNATLVLKDLTQKDSGKYVCWKSNGYNMTRNQTVDIFVKASSAPAISDGSPKSIYTNEEAEVRLRCHVTGSPRPKVTWFKGDKEIGRCMGGQSGSCDTDDDAKYKLQWVDRRMNCRKRNVSLSSDLTVRKAFYPDDTGAYTCKAKNQYGESSSQTATVTLYVIPRLKDSGQQVVVNGFIGQTTDLKCSVTRAYPAPTFKWEYQPWSCDEQSEPSCQPKGIWRNVGGGYSRGPGINSTFRVPSGIEFKFYRCTARNSRGSDSVVYAFKAVVAPPKTMEITPPAQHVDADEGDYVNLTCKANMAVYRARPVWSVGGTNITTRKNARVYVENKDVGGSEYIAILHITSANLNDSGMYMCQAFKQKDGALKNLTRHLEILRLTPPNVIISPSQTQNGEATAPVTCQVRGHPTPVVTWYRNGKELETWEWQSSRNCSRLSQGFYKEKQRKGKDVVNHILTICKTTHWKHTGNYECRAKNSKGSANGTSFLNVLAKPEIVSLPRQEGSDYPITLACSAKGNPTPKVAWHAKNEDGDFVAQNKWSLNRTLLTIEEAADNSGSYWCIANNSVGQTVSSEFKLNGPDAQMAFTNEKPKVSEKYLFVIVGVGGVLVLFLLLVIIVLYRRKKLYGGFYIFTLPPMPDYIKQLDPGQSLLEQTHKLPYDTEWEFPRDRLQAGRPLGSGAFGQVFLAEATGIVAFDPRGSLEEKPTRRRSRFGSSSRPYINNKQVTKVAVKALKASATDAEYKDLLSELKILIHIGKHKNIVNLLGACTKGRECELWVIIEYCPYGNLLDFLRKRRDIFDPVWMTASRNPDAQFGITDLVISAFQVARAMDFLASRRCVHRDLAARNVLVGENYVLKVADFGLARDIYKEEHYVKTTSGLLPVKWMAIEALVDRVYTHQSDVWSFGVLLWELFTLGGSPYPGLPANEVYQFLMEGRRMEQPRGCPEEIYQIMSDCWMHNPEERPTFTELVESFDKILVEKTAEEGEGYLDLRRDDDCAFEDQYLQPDAAVPLTQGSPSSMDRQLRIPLPTIPDEENEMQNLKSEPDEKNKKAFVLGEPPKGKRAERIDSELDKVHRDTQEKETLKSSGSSSAGDIILEEGEMDGISEKEQLKSEDEDKDVCERNSAVFDSPPPYEPRSNDIMFCAENSLHKDVQVKMSGSQKNRLPSNRYISS